MILMAYCWIPLLAAFLVFAALLVAWRRPDVLSVIFRFITRTRNRSLELNNFQNQNPCETQIHAIALGLNGLKDRNSERANKIESLSDNIKSLNDINKDLMVKITLLAEDISHIGKTVNASVSHLESLKRKDRAIADRERERLSRIQEKRLKADLARANDLLESSRLLYDLLKRLLQTRERYRAGHFWDRNASTTNINTEDNRTQMPVAPHSQLSNNAENSHQEPDPFANDPEHRSAARIAKLLISELFLYNSDLVENRFDTNTEKISTEEIRDVLGEHWRDARDTFEEKVAQRVWREKHYLNIELERIIQERYGKKLTEYGKDILNDEKSTEGRQRRDNLTESCLAEDMVAELFLSNWHLVEKATNEVELRKLLDIPYRDAKEKFNVMLSRPNDVEAVCFDIEYERILTFRFGKSNTESKYPASTDRVQSEHKSSSNYEEKEREGAAQLAKEMITDLFATNRDMIDKRSVGKEEFERLRKSFEETCNVYESRIPERIWKNNHYLKEEYAQVLKMRFVNPDGKDDNMLSIERRPKMISSIRRIKRSDRAEAERIAKVIVSNMFSNNRDLIRTGKTEAEIRELLKDQYRLAVMNYESRVPQKIRKEKHYLEIEFEKALQECIPIISIDGDFEDAFRDKFSI